MEKKGDMTDSEVLEGLIRCLSDQKILDILYSLHEEPDLEQAFKLRLKNRNKPLTQTEIQKLIQEAAEESEGQTRLFFSELLRFVDRKGMKDSKVYGDIHMDRKLWYRLRDHKGARTSKENVLKMCLILNLDYWETYYLVNLSGYSFTPYMEVNPTDFVVGVCVNQGEYDPEKVDELLVQIGEKPLFSL